MWRCAAGQAAHWGHIGVPSKHVEVFRCGGDLCGLVARTHLRGHTDPMPAAPEDSSARNRSQHAQTP